MHPNEPATIEELHAIYHELIVGECTPDIPAKIHALEVQMTRLTKEIKARELVPGNEEGNKI